jgi:hypothetical protein
MLEAFEDLAALCADRDLITPEISGSNEYYGHAQALKDYASLPRDHVLKAALEHGAGLSDRCWDVLLTMPLPAILVMSPFRKAFVSRLTDKQIVTLGPYIHYARPWLTPGETAAVRSALGKTLVAFPAHSSHNITLQYSVDSFCRELEKAGRGFDTILINLYWKDALHGLADQYRKKGYKVVTCGHIYDSRFLSRLRSLIEISSMTASNLVTTAIGYSLHLQTPHVHIPMIIGLGADSREKFERDYTSLHDKETDAVREIRLAFADRSGEITPEQRVIAARYWGCGQELEPEGLRYVLEHLDTLYRQNSAPEPGTQAGADSGPDRGRVPAHHTGPGPHRAAEPQAKP